MVSKWHEYYDGFIRHVKDGRYHVVVFANMDDACGRDNEGQPPYVVELNEVNIHDPSQRASVQRSMDVPDDADPLHWAEAYNSYGAHSPLYSESGSNARNMVRAAKRESRRLEADESAYEERMSRPINGIGQTAREFALGFEQGMVPALKRGVEAGNQKATLVARMHGAVAPAPAPCTFGVLTPAGLQSEVRIDLGATGSDDPIAFSYGFAQGQRGEPLNGTEDGELAPEYVRGHAEGLKVKNGAPVVPSFVRP